MKKFKNYFILGFVILFLSVILLSSCDEFKSKEFEIAELDEAACTALTDTIADTLIVLAVETYADSLATRNYFKEFDWSYVDTVGLTQPEKAELRAAWEDSVANKVETAKILYDSVFVNHISGAEFTEMYNLLMDSLESQQLVINEAAQKYRIQVTPDLFNHTVLLNTTFSSIVIFADKNLNFDVIDANANITTFTNSDMPTTTVAGCQVPVDPDAASPIYKAVIQTRLEFAVPNAGTNMMLRIIKHDNTGGGPINLAFVENN